MTLVWKPCGDERWIAAAAPFREGRYTFEVRGRYHLDEYFDRQMERRCFQISYRRAYSGGVVGVALTLGDARIQAATHYAGLQAQARQGLKLSAAEQVKLEADRREVALDTARGLEILRRAHQPPCEQCLRPASPCKERCLRSILE